MTENISLAEQARAAVMTDAPLNNLAELVAKAATGYEFPKASSSGVSVRHVVAGLRGAASVEAFLLQVISSAGQHFLVPVLRVRPQHNMILCPGKERNRPEMRFKRRIGRFTFLPQEGRSGLNVPEDTELAGALLWKEMTEEDATKLLQRDEVLWEELVAATYCAAGLGRRG
jgi:hypothetical protein